MVTGVQWSTGAGKDAPAACRAHAQRARWAGDVGGKGAVFCGFGNGGSIIRTVWPGVGSTAPLRTNATFR